MSKRRLLLLRHAKSDWTSDWGNGQLDSERPLAPRGESDAPRVGAWLTAIGSSPDRVICSSALRTRQTVELAAAAGGWQAELSLSDELYGASSSEIARQLQAVPRSFERLLLVGHQPGFGDFVSRAIGGGNVRFPTAALAALRLPRDDWASWSWGELELEWLVTPKGLPPIVV